VRGRLVAPAVGLLVAAGALAVNGPAATTRAADGAATTKIVQIAPTSQVPNPVALGLNDSGVVAGVDYTAGPFRWQAGSYTILQPLPGDAWAEIYGLPRPIDAAGDVAGSSVGSGGAPQAVVWPAGSSSPVALGFLDQFLKQSTGKAINASGTVLGSSYANDCGAYCLVPTLFSVGKDPVDLGLGQPYPVEAYPFDINAAGVVLYASGPYGDVSGGFALDDGGTVTPVTCDGAHALNDSGLVVGLMGSGPSLEPAYWTAKGGCKLFPLPPGESTGDALSVNNQGEATGYTAGHATMWQADGTPVDLNSLLPPGSGWFLQQGYVINDKGQILGIGLLHGQQAYFLLTPGAPSGELVVNSTGDLPDTNTADGVCDTGQKVTVGGQQVAECTLRAAIQEANARQAAGKGEQTITFGIPGGGVPRIQPASALPDVQGTVTLDGSTQAGGWVELNGALAGKTDGLRLTGTGSVVRGFVVNGFGQGIVLAGVGGHLVEGNRIGTDVNGTVAVGNAIGVSVESAGNLIGGSTAATSPCSGDCNVVSGNGAGVRVAPSSSGTRVLGNVIGLDALGQAAAANGPDYSIGVQAEGEVAIGSTAGTPGAPPGNLIAGTSEAVLISTSSTVSLQGNVLGLTASGNAPSGELVGIDVESAGSVTVGGATAGDGNVISGYSTKATSRSASGIGVLLQRDSVGVDIERNLIGTDATGTAPRPNRFGVYAPRRLSLSLAGVVIDSNVISGNAVVGVSVTAAGTVFRGNRVGTNAAGTAGVPNGDGASISGAGSMVGGLRDGDSTVCDGACNLISGNLGVGLAADGGTVEGNFIGTDQSGTRAIPNQDGVAPGSGVLGGPSAATEGTCNLGCNLISGNSRWGVVISGAGPDSGPIPAMLGATVVGNVIGMSASGQPLGNGAAGVLEMDVGGSIGGHESTQGNEIAGNRGPGVLLPLPSSGAALGPPFPVRDSVRFNSIHDNAGLGIDLSLKPLAGDGPTPYLSSGQGPNHLQPAPRIRTIVRTGPDLLVTGNQPLSKGNRSHAGRIDFYASATCDPTGYGEGDVYLGTATVPLSGLFTTTIALPPAGMTILTATFTGPDDSTSEFSRCAAIPAR
jgi:CSLREA domain-containing protein